MKYETARPLIKSGDLLAFSHFGWKSWHDIKIQAVRLVTRSEYSHVGIAWVVGGRVFCIEATPPLVRIYPLSKLGEFYWLPTNVEWTPQVENFAMSTVGAEYSQWKAIQSVFITLQDNNDGLWQCCEFVKAVLKLAGVNLGDEDTPTGIVKKTLELGYELKLVTP